MTDSGGSVTGPWCVCVISFIVIFLISRKYHGQAIAVQTFCVLVLRWRAPNYISKLVVLMIWIFTTLVIGIPNCLYILRSPSSRDRAPLEVLDIIIRLLLLFVDKIWYSIVDIDIMNDDFLLSARSDIDNEIKRCQRWRGICE